jgi:Flp pilus assembly protein TadD
MRGIIPGLVFELEGNLVAAANAYRETLEVNPRATNSRIFLALLEMNRGNLAEAEEELRLVEPLVLDDVGGPFIVQVGYGYSRLGLREDADRLLRLFEELAAEQRESAANWVIFHLAHGDEEEAFEWLQRVAAKEPYEGYFNAQMLKVNLYRDPILSRPEFEALREQLHFTNL